MEPVSVSVTTTQLLLPAYGIDVFSLFSVLFGGGEGVAGFFTGGGLWSFLGSVWGTISIIAYIISLILLVLYVYASIRRNLYSDLMTQELRDQEALFAQQSRTDKKYDRLQDVLDNAESDNPNDWKLAIIEADIILDETLKQKGFQGMSLGERLKDASSLHTSTINDAWEAHKVRNRIAHDGADFVLTKKVVDDTIKRYLRVFNELGIA
jgi:hypothetical protein